VVRVFHYVYILVSESDPERHYVGSTADLNARLAAHNTGKVSRAKPAGGAVAVSKATGDRAARRRMTQLSLE